MIYNLLNIHKNVKNNDRKIQLSIIVVIILHDDNNHTNNIQNNIYYTNTLLTDAYTMLKSWASIT